VMTVSNVKNLLNANPSVFAHVTILCELTLALRVIASLCDRPAFCLTSVIKTGSFCLLDEIFLKSSFPATAVYAAMCSYVL
jgi:hypothetical protein